MRRDQVLTKRTIRWRHENHEPHVCRHENEALEVCNYGLLQQMLALANDRLREIEEGEALEVCNYALLLLLSLFTSRWCLLRCCNLSPPAHNHVGNSVSADCMALDQVLELANSRGDRVRLHTADAKQRMLTVRILQGVSNQRDIDNFECSNLTSSE